MFYINKPVAFRGQGHGDVGMMIESYILQNWNTFNISLWGTISGVTTNPIVSMLY